MTMRPNETDQSLPAAVKRGTRRVNDPAEVTLEGRNGPSSLSVGNNTPPGVLGGTSATFLRRDDGMTHTHPSAKDERAITAPVMDEDETVSSMPSVEVNSMTPISQRKTEEQVHSSIENFKTIPL